MDDPLGINLESYQLSDEQFYQLCQSNRDLKFERNAKGDLIVMSPTGGETGSRNIEIAYQLQAWSRQNKSGIAFDSSTGFKLPNDADRSPNAAWILIEKWNNLTREQRQKFVPLCPDFITELRSSSDSLISLQKKMREYIQNGTRLGWLIDPQHRQVEIYRQGREVEIMDNPATLSGENVLSGFVLDLESIYLVE